jgi:Domain of unknown function (DUF4886)
MTATLTVSAHPVDQPPMAFTARVLVKLCRLLLAVIVGVVLYIGAVQAGVLPNPLGPKAEGDLALARSSRPGLRVLFVGNSFTFYNSIPRRVRQLSEADSSPKKIFAVQYTAPNWRLSKAARDAGLERLLGEVPWDVVVLQEHGYELARSQQHRSETTDRYATAIAARAGGARIVLFMPWDSKNGREGETYTELQERIADNTEQLARRLGGKVAPVGIAWEAAVEHRPGIDLWYRDGRHPGKRGAYLGACVFYAVLTGRDPTGNAFTGGLEPEQARFFQHVARDVVLDA